MQVLYQKVEHTIFKQTYLKISINLYRGFSIFRFLGQYTGDISSKTNTCPISNTECQKWSQIERLGFWDHGQIPQQKSTFYISFIILQTTPNNQSGAHNQGFHRNSGLGFTNGNDPEFFPISIMEKVLQFRNYTDQFRNDFFICKLEIFRILLRNSGTFWNIVPEISGIMLRNLVNVLENCSGIFRDKVPEKCKRHRICALFSCS